jgi:hypothetical protein
VSASLQVRARAERGEFVDVQVKHQAQPDVGSNDKHRKRQGHGAEVAARDAVDVRLSVAHVFMHGHDLTGASACPPPLGTTGQDAKDDESLRIGDGGSIAHAQPNRPAIRLIPGGAPWL